MSWLTELWRKLLFLFHRGRLDRDLAEEMRQHVEMKTQKLVEAGVPAEEARYGARREFGNATLLKETSREMWGWRLEELGQDLRYASARYAAARGSRLSPCLRWRSVSARTRRSSAW